VSVTVQVAVLLVSVNTPFVPQPVITEAPSLIVTVPVGVPAPAAPAKTLIV
jgi:hypothetical protein